MRLPSWRWLRWRAKAVGKWGMVLAGLLAAAALLPWTSAWVAHLLPHPDKALESLLLATGLMVEALLIPSLLLQHFSKKVSQHLRLPPTFPAHGEVLVVWRPGDCRVETG